MAMLPADCYWVGTRVGPPAVDVARFLVEGPPGVAADSERSTKLIAAYEEELREHGVSAAGASAVLRSVTQAMMPLTQSIIGWAGRAEEIVPSRRMAALRANALRNLSTWLLRHAG